MASNWSRILYVRVRMGMARRYSTNSGRNILKLRDRGMFQDFFPKTAANDIMRLLTEAPRCVYAGFDPTADSLHVGNLLVLINLLHWQRGGHDVIALIGGATGHIGDPSGRTTDRPVLSKVDLNSNIDGITKNIKQIFDNHDKYMWKSDIPLKPVRIFNNHDFYTKMTALDFVTKLGRNFRMGTMLLKQIFNNHDFYTKMTALDFVTKLGRNFRMGTMLLKQSVQTKLNSESGMSFTEFTYQIFQAYDWLYLYQNFKCRFQLGGSDQMGNIMAGFDLIGRVEDETVYGITLPLVTSKEGDKYGKSAGNAIWLNAEKTTPFAIYQFFMRTNDDEVENLLKLFTFDTLGQIRVLMEKQIKAPELRVAQTRLAEQVTLLVHGEEGLKKAQEATAAVYTRDVKSLLAISADDLEKLFEGSQTVSMMIEPGLNLLELAMKARCFKNEGDATRIMKAGGFYVNHERATNISEAVTESAHILPNKTTLLRVGKKHYYIVRWLNM